MNYLLRRIGLLRQQTIKVSKPPAFVLPHGITKIFFGDSVFLRVSKNDSNDESFKEMLSGHYGSSQAFIFAHSALSLTHYFMYLTCAKNHLDKVDKIIIPINHRAFSLQWELNPEWQYRDTLLEMIERCGDDSFTIQDLISDLDHKTSAANYFMYGKQFSHFFLKSIAKTASSVDEFMERRRRIFAYNYLFDESTLRNSKRFHAFDMIVKKFSAIRGKLTFFVLPINYQAIDFLFGYEAVAYLKSNIELVVDYGRSIGVKVHDSSMIADRFCFFNELEATEHLNQNGRKLLLREVVGVSNG